MLLELDSPFKEIWTKGYLRESDRDGRKRVDLINSKNERTTISYARYLKCVDVGIIISCDFEVDHIDNDCSNDDIENLQILTKEEHLEKTLRDRKKRSIVSLKCPCCGKEFERFENQIKPNTTPKCSRRCNALYNRMQGLWLGKSNAVIAQ